MSDEVLMVVENPVTVAVEESPVTVEVVVGEAVGAVGPIGPQGPAGPAGPQGDPGPGTDLSYTAATRVLASSTGADATLPLVTSTDAGLAPASGGGTTNFLRADGTWVAPPGGGGAGDVAGPASATDNALARFDGSTGKLIQSSGLLITDNNELTLPAVATPAAPSSGNTRLFGRTIAGHTMPAFIGASGVNAILQSSLGRNKIALWSANGNGSTINTLGWNTSVGGLTASTRNIATTNFFTRVRRLGYATAATAGSSGNIRSSLQWAMGNGSGLGGFFAVFRFGLQAIVSDMWMFAGFSGSTSSVAASNPASATNVVGCARITGSTNMHIVYGGSSAQTPIDLGANFPVNTADTDVYELALFSPPTVAETVSYTVTRLNTGDSASGTLTGGATVLPTATTAMAPQISIGNNATASAVGVDISQIYVETDN